MHVLVVGTGSIGKRHIANLLALGARVSAFSYRAAAGAESPSAVFDDPRVQRAPDLAQALAGDVDAVVVANRTDLHLEVALQAARLGKHLLLEKPLAVSLAGVSDLQGLVAQRGLVVEAGFMLRCHPNLLWMQQYLASGALGELFHARAAVGQWLPDWRPGTDHRRGYGAFRAQGGGVVFDLIHELDLVHWLLGPVADVSAMTRTVQSLEIETEAVAQIGLRLASGVLAQVHLDYVRPGYGRDMEIVGRHGVLAWDYPAGTVSLERAGTAPEVVHRVPTGFERNTLFRSHMAHFLQRIEAQKEKQKAPAAPEMSEQPQSPVLPAISSLTDAEAVLRLALATHLSSAERRHVRPDEVGV